MGKWIQDVKNNPIYSVFIILALTMSFYHMVSSQLLLQAPKPHLNTHLGLSLLMIFLDGFFKSKDKSKCIFLLLLTSIGFLSSGYIQLYWQDLENRAYFNTTLDLFIGIILIILVMEATRREFGLVLPILTIIAIGYPFVGKHLPEPFRCTAYDVPQTISNLSIGLANGIFGVALPTSANFIFLFVVFGAVLQALGGTRVFMILARLLASRIRGGPGMMAVISSSIVGSITGSAAANVVITGSFTIPLMKRMGYKPEHAAAIEASASTGGLIMPPVMGIVAFGMAGITGIPYLKIISMAVIPALLYYLGVGLYVYLRSGKLRIEKMPDEKVEMKEIILSLIIFLTPFIIIITLLIKGYSVMYVAFWAIISSILINFLKKERPKVSNIIEGFVSGARAGAGIGVSAACIGMVMATLTLSGLGVKLSSGIMAWSGGYLFLALLIIAAICFILGCAGAALTAYFILSVFAVPALVKMKVGFEEANFFVMYMASFAFVTPPIAMASLVAAKLANAQYMKTAVESMKIAIGGFLIPFMFIYSPFLLLQHKEAFGLSSLITIFAGIFCLISLEINFVGFIFTDCKIWERIFTGAGGISLFLYFVMNFNLWLFISGILLFSIPIIFNWKRNNSLKANI